MSGPESLPLLTGIRYGDDFVTVDCQRPDGKSDSLTFGFDRGSYRLRHVGHGAAYHDGAHAGYGKLFFWLKDEAGHEHVYQVLVPIDEIHDVTFELNPALHRYIDASDAKRKNPKRNAAAIPHTLQQAA